MLSVTSHNKPGPSLILPPAPPRSVPRRRGAPPHRQQVPPHHRGQARPEAAADAGRFSRCEGRERQSRTGLRRADQEK